MKMKGLLALVMTLFCLCIQAQIKTCGMQGYMDQMMNDPQFAEYWLNQQINFEKFLETYKNDKSQTSYRINTAYIPVAVHFPDGNQSDRSCLEALAQNQIDIINADFAATNSDAILWNSASIFYPGVIHGDANFEFCLATQNHPNGIDSGLEEGNPAITIGYNFGNGNNRDSSWSGYLNIVVKNLGNILGFSPLGGSISQGYAVTIDDDSFASGSGCLGSGVTPAAPYNLGRTCTHELGHFFNLNHIWGDGGCNVDDGIDDTPLASGSNGGCPAPGSVPGCESGEFELSMNYMDYTNDACMYMFSQGQIDVTEAYVSFVQNQFNTNTINCATPDFSITAITESPLLSCPETTEDVIFEFDFETFNGYNSDTLISLTGVPQNAVVSISPSSINSSGLITVTIGNLSNTVQGEYAITVTGSSPIGSRSDIVILKNTCTSVQCFENDSAPNLNASIPEGAGNNVFGEFLYQQIEITEDYLITDVNFNIDITHAYIGDLNIILQHPDGTEVVLLDSDYCDSQSDLDITFDDEGAELICATPTQGIFQPTGNPLSNFIGKSSLGTWQIGVRDYFYEDAGVLNDWSLEICAELPLSVNGNESLFGIKFYPNPSRGIFNLEISSIYSSKVSVNIFDVLGRIVYVKDVENITGLNQVVDLSNVEQGTYLMTIIVGSKKITKRIIIK